MKHLDPKWRRAAKVAEELHRALGVEEQAAWCTMVYSPKGSRVTVIRLSDGMTRTRFVT